LAGVISATGAMPVPDRDTVCGLPVALSVILSVAERLPATVGVKVTVIMVLPPGVTVIGVVAEVKLKSPGLAPVTATELMIRFPLPEFVTVTPSGMLVPTPCEPKLRLVPLKLTLGAVPVPDSATVCATTLALSLILREAARLPVAVGVKVTLIVVVPLEATVIGNVPAVKEKSPVLAPVIVKFEITRVPVPELVTVIGIALLEVATSWLPKLTLVGLRMTDGAVPVPVKATACGLPLTLSLIIREAERLPVAVGVKVRFTVVLLPGVTVIGNVPEVKEKSVALAPVTARFAITRLAVPLLVNVSTDAALDVPTGSLPRLRLVALRAMPGTVPVPESGTVCGLPLALSLITSEALRPPVPSGLNVTFTAVLLPGVTVIGKVPEVRVKSPLFVPVIAKFEITRLAVPLFVTVTGVGALAVATSWLSKTRLAGLMVMPGAVPVPDSGTDCGLPVAFVVSNREEEKSPSVAGENVTLIVVFPPGATVMGRLFEVNWNCTAGGEIARAEMIRFPVPVLPTTTDTGALVVSAS